MCTEEFIRMMFMVDLYGNRGLDSRNGQLALCTLKSILIEGIHVSLKKNCHL